MTRSAPQTLALALALASCFQPRVRLDEPARSVRPPPRLEAGTPAGTLVVFRVRSLRCAPLHQWIALDGVDVAGLLPGQHTRLRVSAGEHRVRTGEYCSSDRRLQTDEIRVSIGPGEERVLEAIPSVFGPPELKTVEAATWAERERDSVFVEPGTAPFQ